VELQDPSFLILAVSAETPVGFSRLRQIKDFILHDHAVRKAADEGAIASSKRTDDFDAMLAHRPDNSMNILDALSRSQASSSCLLRLC